jgi:hypothetical protein
MEKPQVSSLRLRLGVLLIFLFWLPLWVFAPYIAGNHGGNVQRVTLAIMTLQVIIGVLGVLVAGKTLYFIIKGTPRRKVFKAIFKVIKTGKFEEAKPVK